jgi:hypothetical protein
MHSTSYLNIPEACTFSQASMHLDGLSPEERQDIVVSGREVRERLGDLRLAQSRCTRAELVDGAQGSPRIRRAHLDPRLQG